MQVQWQVRQVVLEKEVRDDSIWNTPMPHNSITLYVYIKHFFIFLFM